MQRVAEGPDTEGQSCRSVPWDAGMEGEGKANDVVKGSTFCHFPQGSVLQVPGWKRETASCGFLFFT